jgi:hypothetical protein
MVNVMTLNIIMLTFLDIEYIVFVVDALLMSWSNG